MFRKSLLHVFGRAGRNRGAENDNFGCSENFHGRFNITQVGFFFLLVIRRVHAYENHVRFVHFFRRTNTIFIVAINREAPLGKIAVHCAAQEA